MFHNNKSTSTFSSFNGEVNRQELLRTVWGRDFQQGFHLVHWFPLIIATKANLNQNIIFCIRSRTQMHRSGAATNHRGYFPFHRFHEGTEAACDPFLIVPHDHHSQIPAAGWFYWCDLSLFWWEMVYSTEEWGQKKKPKHLIASNLIVLVVCSFAAVWCC